MLYMHISLEDTCSNIKVTKNMHPTFETVKTHVSMDNKTLSLVCEFSKQ